MASLNEVKAIAENMECQSGCIMSQDDDAKLLSDHHLKKIEDAGFISMDSPEFTSQMKRNYSALIASQGNVSISKTSTVRLPPDAAETPFVYALAILPLLAQHISSQCNMKILISELR